MQINLRKAHALMMSIQAALSDLDLSTSVTLDGFTDVRTLISSRRDKLLLDLATSTHLNDALSYIRAEVGAKNASSGINNLLTLKARLDSSIKLTSSLASVPPIEPYEVLERKTSHALEASKTAGSFRSTTMPLTGVFTEAEINKFKEDLRSMKLSQRALMDSLLEANMSTTISLKEETVEFLKSLGLV